MDHDHAHDPAPTAPGGAGGAGGAVEAGEIEVELIDDAGVRGGEVIGGDRRPGGVGERLGLWLEAHRRQVRLAGRIATAAAAVVALVVGGLVGVRYLHAPQLPHLVGAESTMSQDQLSAPTWTRSPDGRPSGRPVAQVRADVVLSGQPTGRGTQTLLLGLVGPGLVSTGSTSVVAGGAQPIVVQDGAAFVALFGDAELDCDAAALPAAADRYGLRVKVTDGGRTSTGVLPAGALGTWLAGQVNQACGSWLVSRDVGVTDVTATPDPRQPRAELALTVVNHGAHDVQLRSIGSLDVQLALLGVDGAEVESVTVPAHATATLRALEVMHDCLSTASQTGIQTQGTVGSDGAMPATTAETLGLIGLVGSGPALLTVQTSDGAVLVTSGLHLTPGVTASLARLATTLCGDPAGAPGIVVNDDGARWDARRSELSLRLYLGVGGDSMRGAVLADPEAGADVVPVDPASNGAVTLTTRPGTRFGSGNGAIVLPLTYRLTGSGACNEQGQPQLPVLALNLLVATPSGVRTVPFRFDLSGPQLPTYPGGACR